MMRRSRSTWLAFLLLSLFFFAPPRASGQDALFRFTSGAPPLGDGVDYPRSLNPARQVPNGAAPGQFDGGAGLFFQNSNGNPAFFDANNLITRPASLITNEAFWTDPKFGNFESNGFFFDIASMGFQFVPPAGEDFGFDIAIGSVSETVTEILPVFIQNTDGDTAIIELDLSGSGGGDLLPDQTGTFLTLESPFLGLEARFRIAHSQLEAILGSPAPVIVFSFEMDDIATVNGSTQLAIDNFVIAGGQALTNELQREPVGFRSALIPPGELLYFILDPATSQESGVVVDVGSLSLEDVIELAARSTTPPGSDVSEVASTLTIPAESTLRDVPSVRLSAPGDGPPAGVTPFVTPIGRVDVEIESVPPAYRELYLETTTIVSIYITVSTENLPGFIATPSELIQGHDLVTDTVIWLNEELGLYAGGMISTESTENLLAASSPLDIYVNYSLEEYLAERLALGLDPVDGHTGSSYRLVTDTQGHAVDYLIDTWVIAGAPGVYAPVLFTPEPAGGATLAAGVVLLSFAGRWRLRRPS